MDGLCPPYVGGMQGLPRSAKLDGEDILGGLRCEVRTRWCLGTVHLAFMIELHILGPEGLCANIWIAIAPEQVEI